MDLSFGAGQGESDRVARPIDDVMEFGFKTAARAAMSLRAMFFQRRRHAGGHMPQCCLFSPS